MMRNFECTSDKFNVVKFVPKDDNGNNNNNVL